MNTIKVYSENGIALETIKLLEIDASDIKINDWVVFDGDLHQFRPHDEIDPKQIDGLFKVKIKKV